MESDEKIRIERILGISVTSNAHFDSDSGLLAYPAGNTIVLVDVGSGTVVSHVILETKRPISSLQLKGNSLLFVSSDESNFLRIINWESGLVRDLSPCQNVICSAVSSNLGIIVTVSSDRVVSIWDFKTLISSNSNGSTPTLRGNTPSGTSGNRGRKLASSSVACKISAVYFSPDGNYFVTAGHRHIKFWYIQLGKSECVLTGRPAILGSDHNTADFRDVITDGNATYAIANFEGTVSATLCQFDERRFLDKWVQLKTSQAFCMCMDDDLIFIGCSDGLIRCFRAGKLDFIATLPLPHHLGVNVAGAIDVTALSAHPPSSKFPNVVAISAPGGKKIVGAYADHSLYAWDVQNIKKVGLSHSWLWHSGCIWDISVGQTSLNSNLFNSSSHSPNNNSSSMTYHAWPSFVTCSNDDTVRVWDIVSQTKTNLYSNECQDIKYISTRYLDSPLFISHGNGVRCVGIGHNFLSCGDRQGNLRLWGFQTKNEVIKIKAHKEEILALDVKVTLVATASRDGTVNLYSIADEIDKIATLTEHNGSVTSVKFLFSDRHSLPSFLLISCGADKNLVVRQIITKNDLLRDKFSSERTFTTALADRELIGNLQVIFLLNIPSKTPLFDLEIDSSGKHALVACQDACIRVYNISSGKHSKSLRNPIFVQSDKSSMPTIVKLAIDPSGYYVATAGTDKSITVFDYYKGDVVATLLGHSELALALKFTPDFQNLLSVGGDSCVFVWALPREMVVTMSARASEKRSRLPPAIPPKPMLNVITNTGLMQVNSSPSPLLSSSPASSPLRGPDYKFSFGQLPDWAKKQMSGDRGISSGSAKKQPTLPLPPQGKWSERVEQASGSMTIKSFYNSDTVVSVPLFNKSSEGIVKESPLNPPPSAVELNDSFEICPKSLSEITRGAERSDEEDEEEIQSSDFYSDTMNNKSTDGELSEHPPQRRTSSRPPLLNRQQSDTDTDESSSTRPRSAAPSKRLIDSLKDSTHPHPYEVERGKNAALINSVLLQSRERSKSRLELEKRLRETREKLESIGHKSSISQSTTDLSLSSKHYTTNDYIDDSEDNSRIKDEGSSGIRRACSLSDLNSVQNGIGNRNFASNSAPSSAKRKRSFNKHRKQRGNNSSGGFDSQNIITRSTSMSALISQMQQSDSEPESLQSTPSYMSKTISSSGKAKRKPVTVVSAYSQENLRDEEEERVPNRLRSSTSEQNLNVRLGPKHSISDSPMSRSKMTTPTLKKAQQVYGIPKGLAVVTGVRQGWRDEEPLNMECAAMSVESLRKSLDQVLFLKSRLSRENVREQDSISRILDDGLISAQRLLHESVQFHEDVEGSGPKILSDYEPTDL